MTARDVCSPPEAEAARAERERARAPPRRRTRAPKSAARAVPSHSLSSRRRGASRGCGGVRPRSVAREESPREQKSRERETGGRRGRENGGARLARGSRARGRRRRPRFRRREGNVAAASRALRDPAPLRCVRIATRNLIVRAARGRASEKRGPGSLSSARAPRARGRAARGARRGRASAAAVAALSLAPPAAGALSLPSRAARGREGPPRRGAAAPQRRRAVMAAACCRLTPLQTTSTGFLPLLFLSSLSARCRSRSWTTSSWPSRAATCSGVSPYCTPHAPKSSATRAARKESGGGVLSQTSLFERIARRETRAALERRRRSLSLSRERERGERGREGERERARARHERAAARRTVSARFTSAPAAMSISATATRPSIAATINGVRPYCARENEDTRERERGVTLGSVPPRWSRARIPWPSPPRRARARRGGRERARRRARRKDAANVPRNARRRGARGGRDREK